MSDYNTNNTNNNYNHKEKSNNKKNKKKHRNAKVLIAVPLLIIGLLILLLSPHVTGFSEGNAIVAFKWGDSETGQENGRGAPPKDDNQVNGEEDGNIKELPEKDFFDNTNSDNSKHDTDDKGLPAPPDLPAEIKGLPPNELGDVMILMYHEIGYPEAEWCRTPENFRRDLEMLYKEGYRLVSLGDLLDGNIHIPANTTPVVLTFDDSTAGQFRYIEENGEIIIDPDCAVGIMEDFYEEHPDFGLTATFYIFYEAPFRQPEYVEKKLNYLVERGFEIGNHSYTHGNLSRLSREDVLKQLGKHVQRTREYVPGYKVRSLALPYGAMPSEEELAVKGVYQDTAYHHEAVLLVGWHPAPSPFSADFDIFLPRIRASEMKTDGVGMYEWMEVFRNNPARRFLSDGYSGTVSFPRNMADKLGEKALNKELVEY